MNYSCTAYELKCNECGKRFGNQPLSACPDCLAPLEVAYDLEAARGVFTREAIDAIAQTTLNNLKQVEAGEPCPNKL